MTCMYNSFFIKVADRKPAALPKITPSNNFFNDFALYVLIFLNILRTFSAANKNF